VQLNGEKQSHQELQISGIVIHPKKKTVSRIIKLHIAVFHAASETCDVFPVALEAPGSVCLTKSAQQQRLLHDF
jgi:hypothetical protein